MKKNKKVIKIKFEKRKLIRRERRKRKLALQKKGFEKFKNDIRNENPKANLSELNFQNFKQRSSLKPLPEYSETIEYLLDKHNSFSKSHIKFNDNTFIIPEIFSIIEGYDKTTIFLKKLFNALYNQSFEIIYIDYSTCKQIDVGASMIMDIMLSDFIMYFKKAVQGRHKIKIKEIRPINFNNYEIKKILFSIGAYRNIKGFKINYKNIFEFPIIVGSKKNINLPSQREIDITKTVDYVVKSLKLMNKNLIGTAETNLYKVIGEVIQNADEHSDTTNRYSIGYFETTNETDDKNKFGVLNLSILNFGNTIYETFKNPSCKNKIVVDQMKDLSTKYTKRNLFLQKQFEEETLWTLYALQDGVTSIHNWERGNGAIRFIESFYKLKGNDICDNISKMVITSGHTRIVFDGTYQIVKKERGNEGKKYKMMTFNKNGNIEEIPDNKYVTYETNYFPGTLISVKIRIDYENTENI